MIQRNPHFPKLPGGYLFPEINRRKQEFLKQNPDAHLISLGIGDTTEPLVPSIVKALVQAAEKMGTSEGYVGYSPEQGLEKLRQRISQTLYHGTIAPDEIFISDGAKCDLGRFLLLFGSQATVAIQNPSYPVYVDGAVLAGQTGSYNATTKTFDGIVYMECSPQNNFFPDLKHQPRTDLIYFCSPNNPTGAAATRKQLEQLVAFARANQSIIIYDAAYSAYIPDGDIPKSIYEIAGAKEVAIEVHSFSKLAGFTGVRLGWSVVPHALLYGDKSSIRSDWHRLVTTLFNGASALSQQGGLAALSDQGLSELKEQITFYKQNAVLLKQALKSKGLRVFGAECAPYLWVEFHGKNSWEVFQYLLDKHQLVTTPGSGFGSGGEGFVRFSAFGSRNNIEEAARRISNFSFH